MTRYEQGFLTKCAEYGIDGRELLEKQALIGGLTGYYTQRDDKNAPNASVGGRRGAARGALAQAAVLTLLGLRGGLGSAIGSGIGGAIGGGITGYLGGRLAGHRNEMDALNGRRLLGSGTNTK